MKEVIQGHLPVALPCYDFTMITKYGFMASLLTVRLTIWTLLSFLGVTGGVYKTRERIHRHIADWRLLAIPASCRRVAACNPNWAQFWRFPLPRGFGSFCTGHCSTCAALDVRAMLT